MLAYRQRAVGADLLVSIGIAAAIFFLRFGSSLGPRAWLVYTVPFVWAVAVWAAGGYRLTHIGTGSEEYRAIGKAALGIACAFALVSFSFEFALPRSTVMPFVPLVWLGSVTTHCLLRRDLFKRRLRGQALSSTLVVGRVDSVASMIREISSEPACGMRVIGACVSGMDGRPNTLSEIEGVPVFGVPESALAAVDAMDAEVVAISSHPDLVGPPLRRLSWSLAEREVELIVSPGIVEVAGPRLSLRPAAGLSLLHVERPSNSFGGLLIKRMLDSVLALLIAIVLLPGLLLIALMIKLHDRGPVFFRQERVGAHSERFDMFKFRTMVVDADKLAGAMSTGHDVNDVLFKDRRDPRITRVGRVLRRYSLDELPQLLNVLMGDMSLVGPRPPLPREVDLYEPDDVQRMRVRPGMTGLWQISGRSDLDWEQSIRLDLWYVDNWSPLLDLQIMLRTIRAVVTASGAY